MLADFHPKGRVGVAYGVYNEDRGTERRSVFIIDAEGIVRYAHVGLQQWEIPDSDDVLEVCRSIPCGVAF